MGAQPCRRRVGARCLRAAALARAHTRHGPPCKFLCAAAVKPRVFTPLVLTPPPARTKSRSRTAPTSGNLWRTRT